MNAVAPTMLSSSKVPQPEFACWWPRRPSAASIAAYSARFSPFIIRCCQSMFTLTLSSCGALEVLLGERPRVPSALRAEPPAVEVVGGNVDAHVEPRDPRSVGGVEVCRPLERHVRRRAVLDLQRPCRDGNLVEAAREVRAARERRHDLRSRPTEGAVPRHV